MGSVKLTMRGSVVSHQNGIRGSNSVFRAARTAALGWAYSSMSSQTLSTKLARLTLSFPSTTGLYHYRSMATLFCLSPVLSLQHRQSLEKSFSTTNPLALIQRGGDNFRPGRRSTCRRPPYLILQPRMNKGDDDYDDGDLRTPYTIDDDVCPPTDPDLLRTTVEKHCRTLEKFVTNKPVAKHTEEAFEIVNRFVTEFYHNRTLFPSSYEPGEETPTNSMRYPVIMDSGCGTAKSTIHLGRKFPDQVVVGVDRSLVRLNRNFMFRERQHSEGHVEVQVEEDDEENETNHKITLPNNVLLVRAELCDFWTCYLQNVRQIGWRIQKHYILYPNPYPKKSRFKNRWYAHPSFPLLLRLLAVDNADKHLLERELVVRSNWETYLKEFVDSIHWSQKFYDGYGNKDDKHESFCGMDETFWVEPQTMLQFNVEPPKLLTDVSHPISNFEKKFVALGESVFEIRMRHASLSDRKGVHDMSDMEEGSTVLL